MAESAKTGFTLIDHGRGGIAIELPRVKANEGFDGLDVTTLRGKFNIEALDPGLNSVAHCKSAITAINGDEGWLRHRGYSIESLTENASYPEVVCLLRDGELPSQPKLLAYEAELAQNGDVPKHVADLIRSFPRDTNPMQILQSAVVGLSAELDDDHAHLIVPKIATLAAMVIRHGEGKATFNEPNPDMSHAENFLHMCFSEPGKTYRAHPAAVEAMDKILILHADHEQNASTAVLRGVRSTDATKIASMSAAVGALSGPLHGGANAEVLDMLEKIGTVENIPNFLERVEKKEVQLMGFGHRVYKNKDPRAMVLKGSVDNLLAALNKSDPRLAIARALEERALGEEYFKKRRLFPNVDFYSGIALSALDFQPTTFTLHFAVARSAGWVAHLEEFDKDPAKKIARPRQIFIGSTIRDFVPVQSRPGHNGAPEPAAPAPA